MLTRSASKKQAGTPAGSVIKNEENNCRYDLVKSCKVNIQCPYLENNKDLRACMQNISISIEINPAEIGPSKDESDSKVKIVNINKLQTNSTARRNSITANANKNCSPSTGSVNTRMKYWNKGKDNLKDREIINGSYSKFCPAVTSSTKKRKKNQQEEKSGNASELNMTSNHETPVCKKRKFDITASKEKIDSKKASIVRVAKEGWNIQHLKKKLVVSVEQLSKEKIRALCFPKNEISVTSPKSACDEEPGTVALDKNTSDTLDKKKVRRKLLLEELKLANFHLSKSENWITKCTKSDNCDGLREHMKPLLGENKKLFYCISPEDGALPDEVNSAGFKMVFGNIDPFWMKYAGSSSKDWNEEGFLHIMNSEDSVLTEFVDNEEQDAEHYQGNLSLEGLADEIVDRIASPERTIVDRIASPERTTEGIEIYQKEVDKTKEVTAARMENELNINKPKELYVKTNSHGVLIRDGPFSESGEAGMVDGMFREEEAWCKNKPEITHLELLQLQLQCIKKELQLRRVKSEMSSNKKKSLKPLRKSRTNEKTSENNVMDFGSIRETRRSKRFELMEESPINEVKGMETRKSSLRKRTSEKTMTAYENDVTSTPKSTRAKSLRIKAPETIERKGSTTRETSATRTTSKTIKISPTGAEHHIEEVRNLTSFDATKKITPKMSKKLDEAEDTESSDKEASSVTSTPKNSRSSKKSSRKKILEETIKEAENEETKIISSHISMISKSPLRISAEEKEDLESEGKTVKFISSPLRKKKEAAERLRAEEQLLEQDQIKEGVGVRSTQSPKKPSQTSEKEFQDGGMPESATGTVEKAIPSPTKSPRHSQTSKAETGTNETPVMSSPQKNNNKLLKKQRAEEYALKENESNEMETMTKPASKIEKSESPKKRHTNEKDESIKSESTSPRKQDTAELVKNEDVEMLDQNETDDAEMSEMSGNRVEKDKVAKEQLRLNKNEEGEKKSEVYETCSMVSQHEKEEKKGAEIVESLVDFAETSVGSSPKKKHKKLETGENEPVEDMELDVKLEEISVISETNNKSSKRLIEGHDEKNITKLPDDFLESISSKKIEIKGRSASESRERKKNKQNFKEKARLVAGEDYIPLGSDGPTSFSVARLDKFKSSVPRHPAFDLKRDLLYGSRVKRIPYSELQAYKLKQKSRNLR